MQKVTETKLTGADGLRAIACLMVMFHHFAQKLSMNQLKPGMKDLNLFLLQGNSGVSVFFILSGFLLSYPFWKRYLNQGEFPSMGQYALRRAARIMPGFYVAMILCALLAVVVKQPVEAFWQRFVSGLTFTAGFNYITFFPSDINGPFWSISFEVFSYLLMPLFMIGLFLITGKKRSFLKAVLYWIGVFLVILLVNSQIHHYLTPDNVKRGWQFGNIGGAKYWMPNYNPLGFFGHFTLGIFAAGLAAQLSKIPEFIKRLNRFFILDILALLFLVSSSLLLFLFRKDPEFSHSLQTQPYFFPYYQLLVALGLAILPFTRFMGRILDNGFFKLTAKLSFGLYLWHYVVIFLVTQFVAKDYVYGGIRDLTKWVILNIIVISVSYHIAALSHKYLEKPILDWSHRFTPKSRKVKIPVGTSAES